MSDWETDPSIVLFHTVLTPHSSADRRGERAAVILVVTMLGITAAGFIAIGAWPVFGFCGLEIGLFYGALRLHARRRHAMETINLTPRELTIRQVDHRGRAQDWSFTPYWLRVECADGHGEDHTVRLRSHGQTVIVGSFMAPAERRQLADSLRQALRPVSVIPGIAAPRPTSY
jgi:uncharacterized membrane protein